MHALPFEIREKIFEQFCTRDLCKIAQVSPEWRFMAYQVLYRHPKIKRDKQLERFSRISSFAQSFVQVLDLTAAYKFVTDKTFQALCSLSGLRQINLDQCAQLSPSVIHSLIFENVFSITSLSLEDCRITKDTLALIGEACQQQLTNLNLCHTTMLQPVVNDFLRDPSFSHLAQLDLSYCTWFSNEMLANIARGLPKLQHIELHWCSQITADAIVKMVQELKHLITIDIRNVEAMGSSDQVEKLLNTSDSLKKVMYTYKRLS